MHSRDAWRAQVFVAVAEEGAMGKAAKRLGCSTSVVSSAIADLEKERLENRRLFDRHGRGCILTPDGEEFQPIAQQLVGAGELFDQRVRDFVAGANRVRIGTIQTAWSDIVHQAWNHLGFEKTVRPVSLDSYNPADGLLSGHLQCALLPAPSDHDKKLLRIPLFTEPRVVSVASSRPLARQHSAALTKIDEYRWIGAPPNSDQRFVTAHRCDDIRPGPPPRIGEAYKDGLDIGTALLAGEIIIGSTPSISAVFAKLMPGHVDVDIEGAPPWQVDLAIARSSSADLGFDPHELANEIRAVAAETPGLSVLE